MERVRDNAYRVFTMCVDGYDGKVPQGRICHPSLEAPRRFTSLTDFLVQMEDLLNDLQMPQSFTAKRSFTAASRPSGSLSVQNRDAGKLATFGIRIIFRQNASWQGSVKWIETGQEDAFRSVLELVLLMDSALESGKQTS